MKLMERFNKQEDFIKGIINIVTYYVIPTIIGIPVIIFGTLVFLRSNPNVMELDPETIALSAAPVIEFLIYLILFIVLYLLNRNLIKDGFINLKNLKRPVLMILGFSVLLVTLGSLLSYLYELLGISLASNQEMVEETMNLNPLLSFFSTVLFAPIIEEIIFRFSFFSIIEKMLSKTKLTLTAKLMIANVITAIIFGLMHIHSLPDLINLPQYALLGFIIGLSYVVSKKNLIVASSVHLINNLVGFISFVLTLI